MGDSGVGKTSLLCKYTEKNYEIKNSKLTVGIDYRIIKESYNEMNYVMKISDTAGQEIFKAINRKYYVKANVALIVFSLEKWHDAYMPSRELPEKDTIQNIEYWVNQVK